MALGARQSRGHAVEFHCTKAGAGHVRLFILTVRLPAILFGVASLWMFVRIAREYTASRWPIAAVLFVFLPQIFRYAVEARPYSQGMFFALSPSSFGSTGERAIIPRCDCLRTRSGCVPVSQVFSVFTRWGWQPGAYVIPRPDAGCIATIAGRRIVRAMVPAQRATQAVTHA